MRIPQARIKLMAGKRAVSEQLIEVLPPTPKDLLRTNPDLAKDVFSAQRLPVTCPLSAHVILLARGKIKMRGGSLMCNYLRVVSAECGYNRTHRACMHAHLHHAPLRSVCTSGLSPMALLTSSFLPQQAMMAPYGHPGLQAMHSSDWDRVPLHGSGPPSTLTCNPSCQIMAQLVLRGCSQCSMDPPWRRKDLHPPYQLRRAPLQCPRSWTEVLRIFQPNPVPLMAPPVQFQPQLRTAQLSSELPPSAQLSSEIK